MNQSHLQRLLWGEFSGKRILRSALLIYACVALYGLFFSDHMIFQPQPSSYKDTKEILKLTTSDHLRISAMHLPNPQAVYTILYSHGNAEDLGDVRPVLDEMTGMGFAIFVYDYHGYGTSQGKPSEKNAYRDIDAAYDYLTQKSGVPPDRIIAFGRSVGSGPAVDLASRKPVAGLILESPFLTAFRVVTHFPIFPFDKFRNNAKLPGVHCPVLVIHGKNDRTISPYHGRKLYELANQPKRFLWMEKANHDNVPFVNPELYANTLREFAGLVRESQEKPIPRSNLHFSQGE
ncbi:MAG: alpha/beta hydrolase, partial [Verrucomicrobia bacterium]|nr:alpha/beta hydrolase [Verrucomicrobiota bacterium]